MHAASTASSPLAAIRCWMQGRRVYLEIDADRWISFAVSQYDTLADAPQTELEKIQLQSDGRAIGWESLDEVIQVEDVAHRRFFHTPRTD